MDEERKSVGTCYKEQGADAAIKLGHELVSGPIKAERVSKWINWIQSRPESNLYCFRGGLRSQIATSWIKEAGIEVPRIEGGYKALRNHLLMRLSEQSQTGRFIIIGGKTGSGQTHFIQSLKAPVLDLETLANHRGSSFGSLGNQPAQATFENSIAVTLLKLGSRIPIVIEDESIMIGSLVVPEVLFSAMKRAPIYLLEVELDRRIQNIARDYVIEKLSSKDETPETVKAFFTENLKRIQKKLGGLRYAEIDHQIRSAFESRESIHPETHTEWIKSLLVHYYDPLYERSIARATDRVFTKGDEKELATKLLLP
jgi:tRNA 2-selenouridine synthase